MTHTHSPARRGFTLIELLVVIAIIALLVSILMPSLAKARELVKKSACMMNQRSVGLQLNLYLSANDGLFHGPLTRGGALDSPNYVTKLLDFMYGNDQPYKLWGDAINADAAGSPGGGTFAEGAAWYETYKKYAGVFFCPTAPMTGPLHVSGSWMGSGAVEGDCTSYMASTNTWGYKAMKVPGDPDPSPYTYSWICRLGNQPRPASSVLFGEAYYHLWPVLDGDSQLANNFYKSAGGWVLQTVYDHGQMNLNYLYADGHVGTSVLPPYSLYGNGYRDFIEGGP